MTEERPAEDDPAAPDSAEPDPAEIDPAETDPAEDVSPISKWVVFLLCAVATAVLVALVSFSMSLPVCEDPPNSWAPCIGP
ncbi:hypothetical protein [Citricoccus sp.]|uniref:hypothetical protein n=1 Tax=Citricoccus sp. TaxID=1978372 RepID=UPI0028BF4812|nr:hypothetical protein [Citricoccus sp.]